MKNEEKILAMLEGLTGKVEGISSDLGELSNTVKMQGTVLDKLVVKVDKLEQGQAKLEEDVARLEQLIISTKENVALLENEQGVRIGALFDLNSCIEDIIKKALAEVSSVKPRIEIHSLDIARLLMERADVDYKLNRLLRLHADELNSA